MIILKEVRKSSRKQEATGIVDSAKRKMIAKEVISSANTDLISTPSINDPGLEDFILLYCDILTEISIKLNSSLMGAPIEIKNGKLAKMAIKMSNELRSYSERKIKEFSLL
jgi:hypothetical protein